MAKPATGGPRHRTGSRLSSIIMTRDNPGRSPLVAWSGRFRSRKDFRRDHDRIYLQQHFLSVVDRRPELAEIGDDLAGELTHAIHKITIDACAADAVIVVKTLLPVLHNGQQCRLIFDPLI